MTAMLNRDELTDLVRRGKRAKSRSQALGKIVTGIFTSAAISLMGGFELMIAVGVVHAEWIRTLPTVGYWWAVLLVALLRGVFSSTKPSTPKASA